MKFDFEQTVIQKMDQLKKNDLYRELRFSRGVDFCSNDYLSLSESEDLKSQFLEKIKSYPMGSTGSRLLRGHSSTFSNLEKELAQFSGQEQALYFSSGYQANLGLFSCLLKQDAVVFSDEFIHASIIDGIRLSGCEKYIWSHNDLAELELLLKQKCQPEKLNIVVVESIYSMQGDFAPLKKLCELCKNYGAHLVVDEAHATGLYGKKGAGCVEFFGLEEEVFATIHTAGKAMGVSGAWVAGSHGLRELMINESRPFIYSTAPSFYQLAAVEVSLELLIEKGESLRERFFKQLAPFQKDLIELADFYKASVSGEGSPVTSFVVGENQKALYLMQSLLKAGCDVRAIRSPTVRQGEAQLRITSPLGRTREEQSTLIQVLDQALKDRQ